MNYCYNCGKQLENNARTCPTCGFSEGKEYVAIPEPYEKGVTTMSVLGLIFAFIFPLLGLIFGGMALTKSREERGKGRGMGCWAIGISIFNLSFTIAITISALISYASVIESFFQMVK